MFSRVEFGHTLCHNLTLCWSPHTYILLWKPNSQCNSNEKWSVKVSRLWGLSLLEWNYCLYKRGPRWLLYPSVLRECSNKVPSMKQIVSPSTRYLISGIWILDILASKIVSRNLLCLTNYSVYSILKSHFVGQDFCELSWGKTILTHWLYYILFSQKLLLSIFQYYFYQVSDCLNKSVTTHMNR